MALRASRFFKFGAIAPNEFFPNNSFSVDPFSASLSFSIASNTSIIAAPASSCILSAKSVASNPSFLNCSCCAFVAELPEMSAITVFFSAVAAVSTFGAIESKVAASPAISPFVSDVEAEMNPPCLTMTSRIFLARDAELSPNPLIESANLATSLVVIPNDARSFPIASPASSAPSMFLPKSNATAIFSERVANSKAPSEASPNLPASDTKVPIPLLPKIESLPIDLIFCSNSVVPFASSPLTFLVTSSITSLKSNAAVPNDLNPETRPALFTSPPRLENPATDRWNLEIFF